ncbi:glycosyltransferase family 2 protein [Peribacillus frigoritolerans]|uniref:glycosyltransferase family 2 protein n=1 Tax=Peribacillus frigoritolerans TaxID=450367 RepID=UPI00209CBDED|nr:glycosyltransferase family 2 protein [Peribacillus frigoritolerans]MCP1154193.1 glycosyltransferase family 2 protein [Peribacillus frigoritolerans]
MYTLLITIFIIYAFIIFWAMIGYSLSLRLINKYSKKPSIIKDNNYEPTVTVMIVAHNEEKVIYDKLNNVINLNYPKEKLEILVSSDNSTDKTNAIVREFIKDNKDFIVRLYEVKERKGKTNAQNEAASTVKNEILIMTDANAMLDKESIKELVSVFSSEIIGYVTGRLKYVNAEDEWTSKSESSYWEWDLKMREIESNLHSVTAGNGALYACRTLDYYEFDPIKSHDSAMPKHYVLQGKRAIYNKDAIAYEKAGAQVEDEFGRKVRMSRTILSAIFSNIGLFNVFKYKWFSYCFFGHRYCRQNLWLAHLLVFFINIPLAFTDLLFKISLVIQVLFYLTALLKHITKVDNKIINMTYYYSITIIAQMVGAYRQLTGKSKPFWEKAESTR